MIAVLPLTANSSFESHALNRIAKGIPHNSSGRIASEGFIKIQIINYTNNRDNGHHQYNGIFLFFQVTSRSSYFSFQKLATSFLAVANLSNYSAELDSSVDVTVISGTSIFCGWLYPS